MNDVSTREIETAEPAGYPTSWEFDGLLADGQAVLVRPVKPGDARRSSACTCILNLEHHREFTPHIRHSWRARCHISRRWITENAWRSWYWQRTVWSRSRVLIA